MGSPTSPLPPKGIGMRRPYNPWQEQHQESPQQPQQPQHIVNLQVLPAMQGSLPQRQSPQPPPQQL
eukprot:16446805-Heterocapsa_arctica.AAC.2